MVNNHITLLHILAFHIIKGKKSVFHTYLSKHYSVLFHRCKYMYQNRTAGTIMLHVFLMILHPVSYTHLTLPTKLEV